jgi:hypothetical protein
MEIVCQACGYRRKSSDQAPDWECPACGKAYTKTALDSSSALTQYLRSPVVKSSTRTTWSAWSIASLVLGVACAPFFYILLVIQTDSYHATYQPVPPDRVIRAVRGKHHDEIVYVTAAEVNRDKRLEKLIIPGVLVFASFAFARVMAKNERGD